MNIKKLAGFALGPIGLAAISLLTVPLTAWYFSAEDIGKISMLQTAISFCLLFFSLGLDQAYVREYHETENKSGLFKACILPGGLLLLCCLLLLIIFGQGVISKWLFGVESFQFSLAVGLCIIAAFIGRFMSLILRMQEKGWSFSISQLMPKVIFLLVIGIFIGSNSQKDLAHLLTAHALSFFSVALIFTWSTRKDWLKVAESITKQERQALLKFGLPLIINGVGFWAMTSMDRLFLKHYSSYEELGIYSVTNSFAGVAVVVQNIFSTIWAPTAYRWHSEGIDNAAFQKVTQQMLLVVVFVFSLTGIFSWVLPYFLPAEYENSQYIIMACMMYPLLYSLSEVTGIGVGIARKSGWQMLIMLFSLSFNLLLNIALVPKFGAAGAALSTGLSFYILFILKTEMSAKFWIGYGRIRLHAATASCVLLAIIFVLKAEFSLWIRIVWVLVFMVAAAKGINECLKS